MVDLRSDTVTRPTAAMVKAMIEAPLGDDVYGEDPTVNRLEEVAAERAGKEAGLFVPSGTMANQIAIRILTRGGDEVLTHEDSHPMNWEAGGAAVISGVQLRPLPGANGILEEETVRKAFKPEDPHIAPPTLLTLEDTANRGGGTVYPLDRLDALGGMAHQEGLSVHLDGARVFNAVVESGVPLDRRLAHIDTVSFCLSKGLGCPAGSLLCGPRDAIAFGRRVRKMLGGGMRQAGILAAAGLFALEHHVGRLAEDHRRAQVLAEALRGAGYTVATPSTNLVFVNGIRAPRELCEAAKSRGVLFSAAGPNTVRLALHLDIDDVGVARAVQVLSDLAEAY